jgi:hypothetical protein
VAVFADEKQAIRRRRSATSRYLRATDGRPPRPTELGIADFIMMVALDRPVVATVGGHQSPLFMLALRWIPPMKSELVRPTGSFLRQAALAIGWPVRSRLLDETHVGGG